MVYQHLYSKLKKKESITAGLIGAGRFGMTVLTQSISIPYLKIPVVADKNVKSALTAFQRAGIPGENVSVCSSRQEALRALELNKYVIVEDPMLMMDLPLDVIAESTGIPEAGALHGYEAIKHGKHVAMINKETDSIVGPMLKHLADQAGLVYTPVDGDQHGLVIGLVYWLRSLGLEVVCAGKSRDIEFAFDRDETSVAYARESTMIQKDSRVFLSKEEMEYMKFIPEGRTEEYVNARHRILKSLPLVKGDDICESMIAANATGLVPDKTSLHLPVIRITEIPEVLCPKEEGGILEKRGVIDLVTCFREIHEAGLGGGAFAVVYCSNDYSREILTGKGQISNHRKSMTVIYRPYHLCGVEAPTSILCAGLLGIPTGSDTYLPRYDMIVKAKCDLKAGMVLDCDNGECFEEEIITSVKLSGSSPVPAHMIDGNKLKKDVAAGAVITEDMLDIPGESFLVSLRKQQDSYFADKVK